MIGIAAAILLAAFVFAGAGKAPRTIEAEKIVLLDSHGRARVTIGTPLVIIHDFHVQSKARFDEDFFGSALL